MNLIMRKFGTILVQVPTFLVHFGAFIHPMVTILWATQPAEAGLHAKC